MTEYIISQLLYATDFQSSAGSCWGNNYTYDFKIDNIGNVYIKEGQSHYSDRQPEPTRDKLLIVDNTQIPQYIIDLLKYIIETHCKTQPGNCACRKEKIDMLFDIVQNIKKSINKMSINPQNIIEIQTQIDIYKNINNNQIEEIKNMNLKINNIQTAYIDAINDNKNILIQNKLLTERITELEDKIKKQNVIYVETPKILVEKIQQNYPIYRTPINSVNTGTLPNAANRMVYNKYKGIYEPEEN